MKEIFTKGLGMEKEGQYIRISRRMLETLGIIRNMDMENTRTNNKKFTTMATGNWVQCGVLA